MDSTHSNNNAPTSPPYKIKFILPLLFAVTYIALVIRIGNPSFMINDNVAVSNWAREGYITPVFGIAYTKLIYWVSSIYSSTLNWYGVLLYIGHALALSLLYSGMRALFPSRFIFISVLIFIMAVYLKFLIYLDYGSTAFMLATATLIWLFSHNFIHRKISLLNLFIAMGLLSCAGLLRYQVPAVVIALSFPLFLFAFITMRSPSNPKQYLSTTLITATFLVTLSLPYFITVTIDQGYKRHYSPPEYRAFQNFYNARGRLHDFPILAINRENQALHDKLGWSRGDYERFEHWMFFDEEKYNLEKLQLFKDPSLAYQSNDRAKEKIFSQDSIRILQKYRGVFFVMCGISLCVFSRRKLISPTGLALTGLLLLTISITLYTNATLRFPPRIAWPFLTTSLLFTIALCGAVQSLKEPITVSISRQSQLIAIGLILIGFGINAHIKLMHTEIEQRTNRKQAYENQMKRMNHLFAGKVLLIKPNLGLHRECQHPLIIPEYSYQQVNVGWNTFSKNFYRQLDAIGLSKGSELYEFMVDNPNAIVLADQEWVNYLVDYINENEKDLQRMAIPQKEGHFGSNATNYSIQTIQKH